MAPEFEFGANSGMQIGTNHGPITAEFHTYKRPKIFHRDRSPTSQYDQYTIAWICASHIEMAAAQTMLDEICESLPIDADDTNIYVLGTIKQHHVVISCIPANQFGTSPAGNVMKNIKRTFPRVRATLSLGIGGAVPSKCEVFLGDVVVGTRIMQYDLGEVAEDGKFHRTAMRINPDTFLETAVSSLRAEHEIKPSRVPSILQSLEQDSEYRPPQSQDNLFMATYEHASPLNSNCDDCDCSKLVPRRERGSGDVVIHHGAIASGNLAMRHGVTRDNVARELDVICFELETPELTDFLPCLPIRGICNYSDSHSNEKWQRYAAATAAAYAKELMEKMRMTKTRMEMTKMRNAHKWMCSERRERILDSLRFEQIYARKSGIKAAHIKTCRWLLSYTKYTEWLDPANQMQNRGFLWISGKPGAGKSTIMKFAYLDLTRTVHYNSAVTACFFFHARGHILEKSISGMYRSLLLQLLEGYPELQTVLDDPEYLLQDEKSCPPLNILKELFYSAVLSLGNRSFTCFIDALDECDEQQVVEMVQCFEDLAEQATANEVPFRVCFSSRHYPHIITRHGIRFVLEEQPGHTEDLSAYVASRLAVRDPALTKELRCAILEKAAGVFMWVVLVVDILNEEDRNGAMFLKRRLAEIPSGLTELFKDILGRNTKNKEALFLCLIWILYAERPLAPNEFYHAIWSGLSLKDLVDDQIPDVTLDATDNLNKFRRYVTSASKGLAETTSNKKPTVQFIHESVRDFLVKDKGLHELWPEIGYDCASPSHEMLKQCCSIYLNNGSVRQRLCELPLEYNSTIQSQISEKHPFLKYATQHILYHANLAAKVYPQEKFLSGFAMSDWIHLNNVFQQFKIRRYAPSATQFYVFAERGLSRLVRTVTSEDPQSLMKREKYKYPFFAALASGCKDTVAAVLGLPSLIYNGVDIMEGIEVKNDFRHGGRTPLSWAAQKGQEEIFKLLLTDKNVDQRDRTHQTPLMRASESGSEVMVETLIRKGADIHTYDQEGQTALHWASLKGHEAVARILIRQGAKLHAEDQNGLTPLGLTLEKGRDAVARLLIEEGADIRFRDEDGKTPLHWASNYGRETMARLLTGRGAEIHAIDDDGRTALHWASKNGCEAVIEHLIQTGADIHTTDKGGKTPLHFASENGREAAVKLLLSNEADVEIRDKNGKTPLHLASEENHEPAARLLIGKGADVHAIDQDGKTPLHLALENSHQVVVMLLVDKCANVYISDKDGQTPLHCVSNHYWNSSDGLEAVVKGLISKAADIDSRNKHRQTPLHWALINGRGLVAMLLMKGGANVHASDQYGRTSLHFASAHFSYSDPSCEVVAGLLIDQGTDLHTCDEDGMTPLLWALRDNREAMAMLLIDHGADIHTGGKDGRTPLHWAAQNNYDGMLRLFIAKGVSVHAKDEDGNTPLLLALSRDREAMAMLLIDHGADIHTGGKDRKAPVHWAAQNNYDEMLRFFIANGVSVHASDNDGKTPLHWASEHGREAVVKFLIQSGANINNGNKHGETPLHCALKNGYEAVARLLITKGADARASDKQKRTSLHWVVKCKRNLNGQWTPATDPKAMVSLLIEKNADIHAVDEKGRTPLHWASSKGEESVAKLLIRKGAEIHTVDQDRRTPLHWAASKGSKAVATLLIKKGADVSFGDKDGQTPLHYASSSFVAKAMVSLLIEKGADVHASDKNGRTPLHCASQRGCEEVARILIEKGADIHAVDSRGREAFEYASHNGPKALMRLLKQEHKGDSGTGVR